MAILLHLYSAKGAYTLTAPGRATAHGRAESDTTMNISKKIEVTTSTNAVDLIRELTAKYPKIGAIVVRSQTAVVIDYSDLGTQPRGDFGNSRRIVIDRSPLAIVFPID